MSSTRKSHGITKVSRRHFLETIINLKNVSLSRQSPEALKWYLEVSHHDEPSSTDPRAGQAGRVENTVLVLLYHMSVTQQANQHHWKNKWREKAMRHEVKRRERRRHCSSYSWISRNYKLYFRSSWVFLLSAFIKLLFLRNADQLSASRNKHI